MTDTNECPVCWGSGEITETHWGDTTECTDCDGTGAFAAWVVGEH